MGSMIGFGLGALVGAVCAFGAGRRYERAHRLGAIAALHVGEARVAARGAVGSVALFAVALVVGALFVWFG